MRLGLLAVVLAVPAVAHAEWPEANPARPSFSDNASTTAVGAFEVEAGLTSDDRGDTAAAQYTFKYGLSDRFDVRLNLEHKAWGDLPGDTRGGLLLKYTLRVPDERKLGVAIEPYVNLPSSASGGAGFGGGGLLAATYVAGRIQVDSSLVVDVDTAEMQDTAVTVTPIVTVGSSIAGELGGYVEGAVEVAAAGGGKTNPLAGVGLSYAATKFLVFDAPAHGGVFDSHRHFD